MSLTWNADRYAGDDGSEGPRCSGWWLWWLVALAAGCAMWAALALAAIELGWWRV